MSSGFKVSEGILTCFHLTPHPSRLESRLNALAGEATAGFPPPTRFQPFHGTLGKCHPWHLTVGSGNPSRHFVWPWHRLSPCHLATRWQQGGQRVSASPHPLRQGRKLLLHVRHSRHPWRSDAQRSLQGASLLAVTKCFNPTEHSVCSQRVEILSGMSPRRVGEVVPFDRRNCTDSPAALLLILAPLGARVGLIIGVGQMLKIEVGVDLGGGQIGMAQQFLHRAQVAAGLQHMGGERVA
ncbi:hypothetical protein OJHNALOF_00208 [Oceanimonas sp. MB9]|nr:hypothetical protein [Oceanimonas sp. MB9]